MVVVAVTASIALWWGASASAGVPRLLEPMRHMQRVMGMRVARHAPAYHWYRQVAYGFSHPPHRRAWLCIHRYEETDGRWTDSGAPYYGGLQMDLGFQRAYGRYLLGRKGTAEHWTPLEQMWVAERAHRTRGFYPWPNTARYCGLI